MSIVKLNTQEQVRKYLDQVEVRIARNEAMINAIQSQSKFSPSKPDIESFNQLANVLSSDRCERASLLVALEGDTYEVVVPDPPEDTPEAS